MHLKIVFHGVPYGVYTDLDLQIYTKIRMRGRGVHTHIENVNSLGTNTLKKNPLVQEHCF